MALISSSFVVKWQIIFNFSVIATKLIRRMANSSNSLPWMLGSKHKWD